MIRFARSPFVFGVGISLAIVSLACLPTTRAAGAPPQTGAGEFAREILDSTGVSGGLVVHVGCGDGALTADLGADRPYLVHGLDCDAANVAKARDHVRSLRRYGRVSIDRFDGKKLPYVDDLVSLVVAEDLGEVPTNEVMRVLAPLGVAYVKQGERWVKTIKPWPEEIDDWPHYLHGPDNNAVAEDTVVGPPQGLQWVGGPRWSRAHSTVNGTSCMVSSGDRLFTIEDRAPIELPLLPGKYTLVARDAFNGVVLWKRRLASWENISHWMKPTPVQLTRRLMADGDRVYATLGIVAPVTALDADTGEVLEVYQGTESAQEIVCAGGVLYMVTGDPMNPYGTKVGSSYYRPHYMAYGEEHYSPLRPPKEGARCAIAAVDADSGEVLWRKSGDETAGYQATTLAVRGDRLSYQTGAELVYADRSDGRVVWKKPVAVSMEPRGRLHPGGTSPTLVLLDDFLLRADARELVVFSTRDGSVMWRTPTSITYHSSPDIFVVDDTVWLYPSTDGYDLATGEVVAGRKETRDKPMGHDRCYRNKATVRYMINSRSGGADFSRLGGDWSRAHPWVRGTCSLGIMPSGGLLYASPHACSCVNETKLNGFYALHARPFEQEPENVLVRGLAYGKSGSSRAIEASSSSDWPTYRQNAARTGVTEVSLARDLEPAWTAEIPDPTAPVIAAGRVYIASKDAHTLHCLDAADGAPAWTFTADGRIDSPPTHTDGRVLFGSADGWVYCLSADAGKLAWKFRAAPEDRMTAAFGQIESLWPVHGSVLVLDDTAYVVAGRQSFLDGGLFLFGLDVKTGQAKCSARIAGPYEEDGESVFDQRQRNQIKGNLSDVLVSDGELIYLRHMAFDRDLTPSEESREHLATVSGFLDDSGHHRSYWTIAPRLIYDTQIADNIDADLLVVDGPKVFGTRISASNRGPEAFDARQRGFILFAVTHDRDRAAALRDREVAALQKRAKPGKKALRRRMASLRRSESSFVVDWQTGVQVNGKAMIEAGDWLVIAGTPNEFPEDDVYRAVEGRAGGVLAVFSTADGEMIASHRLAAPPAWDAMAAADGRLFLACKDGTLICFE